ncbi:hypothetical protein PLICRDRAFT_47492 [Plicaturopsis crispa FD-325 SS-3]|uniref:Uncharacterized protein n=1 Tax=Plicaturopsis crispa FD-325 SS-3 TaxID=944288 RepID=A0A0C9SJY3_PLICR|nr:hypothetical protein PLICRDRAFT_47492 [Plicaturopsis crispa FD-325 SS-3]
MPTVLEVAFNGGTRKFRATEKVVTCEVCEGADHIVCPWGTVIPALLGPFVSTIDWTQDGYEALGPPLTSAKDMHIEVGAFFNKRIELECYEDWLEYMQGEQDDQLQ